MFSDVCSVRFLADTLTIRSEKEKDKRSRRKTVESVVADSHLLLSSWACDLVGGMFPLFPIGCLFCILCFVIFIWFVFRPRMMMTMGFHVLQPETELASE